MDRWMQTPFGPGRLVSEQHAPSYLDLGDGVRIFHREPFVSVALPGYGAPHDFPPDQVTLMDTPPEQSGVEISLRHQTFVRVGTPPLRGQVKQVMARLPERFRVEDVRVALLQAIGDRDIDPARVPSVERRAPALVRRMLKAGLIKEERAR